MSASIEPALPCPCWTAEVPVPEGDPAVTDFAALPASRGVLALADRGGRTIGLAISADVRRLARRRLLEPDEPGPERRRIDYRAVTGHLRAVAAGSSFEAEWACRQIARVALPHVHALLAARSRPWFVHCDPSARFPRFARAAAPRPGGAGVWFGPFADRTAAARYVELLEDVFDLCRYHDVLVQAPRGTACAYKEMGRCPAPCDGTVTLEIYRRQIDDALAFASAPPGSWRREVEAAMAAASAALDFEGAARHKARLERAAAAKGADPGPIGRLDALRLLAVQPAPAARASRPTARLFVVLGGWVCPALDVPLPEAGPPLPGKAAGEILHAIEPYRHAPVQLGPELIDNIGLICRHLMTRAPRRRRGAGSFLPLDDTLDASALRAALRRIRSKASDDPADEQSWDEALKGS